MPTTKPIRTRSAERVNVEPKNPHSTKVQRKVVESNMRPHPTRYSADRTRNTIIGNFNSFLAANQP